jgi:AraC-like DNA-binding protein
VEVEEDKAVNSLYNYINDNHTEQKEKVKKAYQNNLMLMGGILFLLLLTWAILRYRYRNRARQYERFINYFEKKQNPIETLPEKEVSKRMNIPKETEEALIKKLNQFENSKQFTKQDMSLALLASQFETNTKYLSEIINTYKNKNFNSYINELRINYITDRLKNNKTYLQYKISYLAEESGFSSHSSFATVFKAVTGIPPTVFIELLRDQKKQSKIYAEEYEEAE